MDYKLNTFGASGRCMSGASLAQRVRRMSASERACFAADVVDGKVVLTALTAKSVAAMTGTNASYLYAALRLSPEQRQEVRRGIRPLIPLQRGAPARATDWNAIDDNVLVDVVRAVGIDRTLNAAVAAEYATTTTTTTTTV
jgi:hypothetical protein